MLPGRGSGCHLLWQRWRAHLALHSQCCQSCQMRWPAGQGPARQQAHLFSGIPSPVSLPQSLKSPEPGHCHKCVRGIAAVGHTVIVGRALSAASSWGPTGFSMRKLSRFWGTGSACELPMIVPQLHSPRQACLVWYHKW